MKKPKNLDETLEITWKKYTAYLKQCVVQDKLSDAIAFIESKKYPATISVTSEYPLYAVLVYISNNEPEKALQFLKKAHYFGYKHFWKCKPDSVGWSDKQSPEYLLLQPIHQNKSIQEYVQSVFQEKVIPWGFDITETPFCWFEKTILTRQKEKCEITKNKLTKGEEVYAFRFFNGSYDIPTDLHYAQINAFQNNLTAKQNLQKYQKNNYKLTDFAFKIDYSNPQLNYFWNNIKDFDLLSALQLIAKPPVYPTQYISVTFDEKKWENKDKWNIEKNVHLGSGGQFINLLYVLIKCGYLDKIIQLLPQLPEHFPYLFLFFENQELHQKIAPYVEENIEEMAQVFQLALKPHNKKTPKELVQIISYGKHNPHFLRQLATCLNLYECHLYDNSNYGINWFFQDFSAFGRAKGGGLLEFFIGNPQLISALDKMMVEKCVLYGVNYYNGYNNAKLSFYRVAIFSLAYQQSKKLNGWLELPVVYQGKKLFENFIKKAPKYIKAITENNK